MDVRHNYKMFISCTYFLGRIHAYIISAQNQFIRLPMFIIFTVEEYYVRETEFEQKFFQFTRYSLYILHAKNRSNSE